MIKKLTLLTFIISFSTAAFSQLSVGANFSSINFLAGSEVSNTGFGVFGNYGLSDVKDGLVAFAGIGIYSAYEQKGTFTATALSSTTSPSSIDVNYTNEIPVTHVFVGLKKYFVGDYDDTNFGLYGSGQIGFMSSKSTLNVASYDDTNYDLGLIEDEDNVASNFMFGFGVGLEKGFDFGFFFIDAKLNITSNEENGQAVEVEIPSSTEINIGYRYMFN